MISWNGRAGRCKGVFAKGSDHYDGLGYVMLANNRFGFALFLARKYNTGVQSEIDGMIASLSL